MTWQLRSFRRFFTCIVLVLVLSAEVHAQRYYFFNLNVESGLIQSQATSMAQDVRGRLWIGTLGGLSCYDGKNFTNYTVHNGLLHNAVLSLAADKNGDIWIGGATGLSRYEGKNFRNFTLPPGQTNVAERMSQELKITGDTVWWRVDGIIYYVHRDSIAIQTVPENARATAIWPGSDFWAATNGLLLHRNGAIWDTLHFDIPWDQTPPHVYKIVKDAGANVWVLTNSGLYKVEGKKIAQVAINGLFFGYQPVIHDMVQDKNGAYWLCTSAGVIKLNGNTGEYYGRLRGLSDNSFNAALLDAEGNVWLASDGQGVFRYSGTQFSVVDESTGLKSAQVMAIAADHSRNLFFGTYDGGLYLYNNGAVSALPFPVRPTPSITSLCYTHGGRLWIGTRGQGLWKYDVKFTQYQAPLRHFPSNDVTALYEDTAKQFWIGFANGAVMYARDTFRSVPVRNSGVFSFLTIGQDSTLMATATGLMLYHMGTVEKFVTHAAPDSEKVECFAIKGKNLWLGTSDNGILCYNLATGECYRINKRSGLQSEFIYNLTIDNNGDLWAGTGYGIHRINVAVPGKPVVTFYGKSQGITGMESNINSALKWYDGSIWFGTTNGALHYQPQLIGTEPKPVGLFMESVKLFGENITNHRYYDTTDAWQHLPYNLHLPYQQNNITLTFQGISLCGEQQMQYRYRLDGLDAPWSNWANVNTVTYSSLPPGNYTLIVECRVLGGAQTKELRYAFEIETPFQKTKWFKVSVLAACILLGIAIQWGFNSRKERRQRLLAKLRSEEQAKIRLRTAEDFHDEVGNKLTRINLLTNILKDKTPQSPEINKLLQQIQENTGQLYTGTRDILWSLKPMNDNLNEIMHHVRDFGTELFQDTETKFEFIGADDRWKKYRLPLDISRNFIMIIKEALNNCLKYAHAANVSIEAKLIKRDALQIIIKDDGQGFDIQTVKRGHGINNMHTRATRLQGRLYIDSRKGKGTIINLSFKLPPNR
jgi:ligand-binding sensor domain-containing protein/signal transduction histidine kinase